MAFDTYYKDPQAILDYKINWGPWLDTDTIYLDEETDQRSSTWSAPAGIQIVASSATDTTATVWLAGGTVGDRYDVTNEITTDGGRTDDKTITIVIEQR